MTNTPDWNIFDLYKTYYKTDLVNPQVLYSWFRNFLSYFTVQTMFFFFVLIGFEIRIWLIKVRYRPSPQRRISPRRSSDDGKGTGGSLFCTARACDVIARLYFCTYTPGHRRTWRDAYLPCNGHAFVNTTARDALVQVDLLIKSKLFQWYSLALFLGQIKLKFEVNVLSKNTEALTVHPFIIPS